MKKTVNLTLLLFTVIMFHPILTGYSDDIEREVVTNVIVKLEPIVKLETVVDEVVIITKADSHDDFLAHIGFFESGNDYKKINTLGYLGKYQFGKSTLKTLKYKGSIKDFLNSSNIQENLMIKNLNYNKRRLRKTIKTYSGTIIDGVTITESGMLAAAHLSGQGNVKRFFRNGKNPKDAYGSSVTKYLKEFSGYNLNLK